MRVLVTGANGFVGRVLLPRLLQSGEHNVRAAVRKYADDLPEDLEIAIGGDLSPNADWRPLLEGCDAVVHLAARVHVMRDEVANPGEAYHKANVEGTLQLARQAVEMGVSRFIFVSSIKVNGEETPKGTAYREESIPAPLDPYGISKWKAEEGLRRLAKDSPLEVVILRPPLVYGPGVKANFLSMMRWLDRGIPLPLAKLDNARSFVAVDNLVDVIALCLVHPEAANETFLVSDGEDLSTSELLARLAHALGRSPRLFYLPLSIMTLVAKSLGKQAVMKRLFGSLRVDSSKVRRRLGWTPPLTVEQALAKVAEYYRDISSHGS